MKLNIFSIPVENLDNLTEKLEKVKMQELDGSEIDGWKTKFFFSVEPDPVEIPWINHFPNIFKDLKPKNAIYYGVYIWKRDNTCFCISFGKSHFYLRQYADTDFGLQIATRIANKDDITQKAARKFAGRKKKEIRSYAKETSIDIESGESIDYIQGGIINEYRDQFGKKGKFGMSLLLTLDLESSEISKVLNNLYNVTKEEPKFELPKIETIKDETLIENYDLELIEKIKNIDTSADFSEDGHYIVGIDFIFPSHQKYKIIFKDNETVNLDSIDLIILKKFIDKFAIPDEEILDIRIKVIPEDSKAYSRTLKQSLEFILDGEKVMLSDGEWKKFNEDYLTQLHTYIDDVIQIDTNMEAELKTVTTDEPSFNIYAQTLGYELADKDFSKINIPAHTIEAWDLKKDKIVYAVKFGTAQKLGYVCDQASNIIDLIKNNPQFKTQLDFDTYCIWLGIPNKKLPDKLSEIGSIIFKQKLEMWARKCREMGIIPLIRISRKTKKTIEDSIKKN